MAEQRTPASFFVCLETETNLANPQSEPVRTTTGPKTRRSPVT